MPNEENVLGQGFHTNPERINKLGRKVGSKNRATIVKMWLDTLEKIKNPITGIEEILTQEDIITLAIIRRARKGDVGAYKQLLDSAYGQALAQTEISGELNSLPELSKLTFEQLKELISLQPKTIYIEPSDKPSDNTGSEEGISA
jgi:hypothetical protein